MELERKLIEKPVYFGVESGEQVVWVEHDLLLTLLQQRLGGHLLLQQGQLLVQAALCLLHLVQRVSQVHQQFVEVV